MSDVAEVLQIDPFELLDRIVFDAQTVSDRATFERPAQTATGMRHVIVNGIPVIANGELIRPARPGRAIRRGSE